jgi:DNA-binding beta-propeller fold protein YncE
MLPFILNIVIANPKRNLFPRLPGVDWLLGITLAGLVSAAPLPANAQVVTQGQLVATFNFGAGAMVYDYTRNRVYATVPASNSVAIIDAQQLLLLKMIFVGSNPQDLTISPDGSRLYVANSGATVNGIGIVDLNNLVALPAFTTSNTVWSVFAGLSNQLYALSGSCIYILNATNGSVVGQFLNSFDIYSGAIRGTPDHKTLFYGQFGLEPSSLTRIDISATNPVVEETTSPGENGESLNVSPLGHYVVFPNGYPYDIPLFCTTNLNLTFGTFNTGAFPSQATFDPAERYLYEQHSGGSVGVWNVSTFVKIGSIPANGSPMLVDSTGELLFISNGSTIEVLGTGAPSLGPTTPPVPQLSIARYSDPFAPMLQLGWQTQITQTYQFQTSTDMVNWANAGSPIVGNGTWTNFYDFLQGQQKFYRLQIQNH